MRPMTDISPKTLALRKILSLIGKTSAALLTVSGAALVTLVMLVIGDVLLRNFSSTAITGVAEYVSEWMMPLTVLFALAYTEWKNEHIRVTLVEDSLGERPKQLFAGLGQLVACGVAAILAWSSIQLAIDSTAIRETVPMGSGALEVWPIKLIIAVAWVWMALQTLARLMIIAFPDLRATDHKEPHEAAFEPVTTEGDARA